MTKLKPFTAFKSIKTVDLSALSADTTQTTNSNSRPPLGSFINLGKSIKEIQQENIQAKAKTTPTISTMVEYAEPTAPINSTMVDNVDQISVTNYPIKTAPLDTSTNSTTVKTVDKPSSTESTMVETIDHTPSTKSTTLNLNSNDNKQHASFLQPSPQISQERPLNVNIEAKKQKISVSSQKEDKAHQINLDSYTPTQAKPDSTAGEFVKNNSNTHTTMVESVGHSSHKSTTNSTMVDFVGANYKINLKSKYTKIPNSFFELSHTLRPVDQILYLLLLRLSHGWGSSQTYIPLSPQYLSTYTGMSHVTIRNSLRNLETNNYIARGSFITNRGQHINVKWIDNNRSEVETKHDFGRWDNEIFDSLLKILSISEFLVFCYLYRLSYGFNRNITIDKIGATRISQTLNLSNKPVVHALKGLISKKLIVRLGNLSKDGFVYRVTLPAAFFSKGLHDIISYEPLSPTASTMVNDIYKDSTMEESFNSTSTNPTMVSINSKNANDIKHLNSLARRTPPTQKTTVETLGSKNKEILKTSSGDADDFFNILKINLPDKSFPIARETISAYLSDFGRELCEKHITRLKARLMTAENAPGLWIDSLKNPAKYPELEQKSQNEILIEQREQEARQRRAVQLEEQKKKETIERIKTAWSALDEFKQNQLIEQSEKYFCEQLDMKGR
ncbi:MAG: hypothetical protein HQM16_18715, partial [Deltaproteobacteria bacterium]|nr:hypothetical protein [Deltaproteobacteria bacterium]